MILWLRRRKCGGRSYDRHPGRSGHGHRRGSDLPAYQSEQFLRAEFHLRTYMEDSAGMNENDPVRVNGILVGYIEGIKLSGIARSEADRGNRHGDPGQVSGSDSGGFESRHQRGEPAGFEVPEHHQGNASEACAAGRRESQRYATQDIPEIMAQSYQLSPSSKPSSAGLTVCSPLSRTARGISAN